MQPTKETLHERIRSGLGYWLLHDSLHLISKSFLSAMSFPNAAATNRLLTLASRSEETNQLAQNHALEQADFLANQNTDSCPISDTP